MSDEIKNEACVKFMLDSYVEPKCDKCSKYKNDNYSKITIKNNLIKPKSKL